jgi:hypothetical protein
MIVLSIKGTGVVVGQIGDDEFQVLVDQLEEESEEDTDYYIAAGTVEMLARNGASQHLIEVLEKAVGTSGGVELSWRRE